MSITVHAPAKVNLGLAVIARRGDGYHELETIMAKLSLADELTVELTTNGRVTTETTYASELPAGSRHVPASASNICTQAAEQYLAAAGSTHGARITLHKRIPTGAGLAGGSADAAATIAALHQLLNAPVDVPALAKRLGSDVPFSASAYPAALARGRGERLRELPAPLPTLPLVLVNPGFEISAQFAYEELVGFSPRLPVAAIIDALRAGEAPKWRNALQPGVFRHHPELRTWQRTLQDASLVSPLLSGSGPTMFGLATSMEHAKTVAETLRAAHPTVWVQTAHTISA